MIKTDKLILQYAFLLTITLFIGCSHPTQNQSESIPDESNALTTKLPGVNASATGESIYINNDSILWNNKKIDFVQLENKLTQLKNDKNIRELIVHQAKDTNIERIVKIAELTKQLDISMIIRTTSE